MSGHSPTEITASEVTMQPGHAGSKIPAVGAVIGVAGLGVAGFMIDGDPKQFFFSYLTAYLFFLSLALGGMFFVLAQHVARAGWSVVVRRFAENVMGTSPLFVLLFVPVALGAHDLFHWTHADAVAEDPILQHKQPYLNESFFFIRAVVYLLVWSVLGWWFRRQSVLQDSEGGTRLTRRLQRASGPAILLYAVTVSFAAFDWIMSLDPHWFSTIFGIYFFAGSVVGIFALLVLMSASLRRAGLTGRAITVEHFHDLGKLLFAFVAFWAYIAFSQYFLIWYANIPEETAWFLHRWNGAWQEVSVTLGVGHFVIPFFFLLPRTIKRSTGALMVAAVWMLGMHYMDLYWLVMPTLHHHGAHLTVMDVATFFGVGGLFLATLGWLLKRHALVPLRDPRLSESLAFENV